MTTSEWSWTRLRSSAGKRGRPGLYAAGTGVRTDVSDPAATTLGALPRPGATWTTRIARLRRTAGSGRGSSRSRDLTYFVFPPNHTVSL